MLRTAIFFIASMWLLLVPPTILSQSLSDTADPVQQTRSATAFLEIDPTPFFSHGYSIAGGVRIGDTRYSLNAFSTDYPDFALEKSWHAHVRFATSARIQHYFTNDSRGIFVGLQAGFLSIRYSRDGTSGSSTINQAALTPTAGYRWMPSSGGIYVMPAMGIGVTFWNSEKVRIATFDYSQPVVTLIGALHIGFEF